MPTTLASSVEIIACNAIVDLVDAGASPGILEYQTAGGVEVATLTLSYPAFGNAAGDPAQATLNAVTSDTSATGGVAAKFAFKDSNGNAVINGDIVLAGQGTGDEIELQNLTIQAGTTVSLSSYTFTLGS